MAKKNGKDELVMEVEGEIVDTSKERYVRVPRKLFDDMVETLKAVSSKTEGDVVNLKAEGKHVATIIRHEPGVVDIWPGEELSKTIEDLLFKP